MAIVSVTPRLEGRITLRDGRTLAYAEWGDSRGRPIVKFHGMFATRLQCPDADATMAAGVRLITVDRPGYGWSTRSPAARSWAGRTTMPSSTPSSTCRRARSWAGPAAAPTHSPAPSACPPIVTSVGVAGSVGPITEVPGSFKEEERRLSRLLPDDPQGVLDEVVKEWQGFADDPTSVNDGWIMASDQPPSPDARLFARPDVREAMTEWARDAARQGSAGVVADVMAFMQPWGFPLAEIRCDAAVWVGDEAPADRDEADFLAAAIPGSTYVILPGEGHLAPITRWAEMLAWLH